MHQQDRKVRVYDLAKELKMESKKVLSDAQREGADVSVPSNSISWDIAERIRNKYMPPKKTVAPTAPRLIKVIKKEKPVEEAAFESGEATGAATAVAPAPAEIPQPLEEPTPADDNKPRILVLKPQPQTEREEAAQVQEAAAEASASVQLTATAPGTSAESEESQVEQQTIESQAAAQTTATPAAVDRRPPPAQPIDRRPQPPERRPEPGRPQGTQVRPLSPRPGVRVTPAPPPSSARPTVTPIKTEYRRPTNTRDVRGRAQTGNFSPAAAPKGLATEATPHKNLTVYVPQQDNRPKGRNTGRNKRRGPGDFAQKHEEGKTFEQQQRGRFSAVLPKPKLVFTELRSVKLIEGATVKDFSEKLEIKPKDIVTELLKRGVMATINQTLNQEVAKQIGKEYGFDVTFLPFEAAILDTEEEKIIESGDDNLLPRAPVVTVMGHVDHGKTSLLDAIRQTHVAEGEAGGITQHIGAYSVDVADPDNPEKTRNIVFLDTPGHEAFTMMRARGAKVTDVVVLVVAADDGVMPQTIEAIDHSKAAEVRIIVAINKVDKAEANPDRVKQGLADRGLLWEGWGGDTVMVEVSAKQRTGLKELLELIILSADLLELKANPDRLASGVVLEAKLDRGRGSVATLLVQQGTMKVGDPFIVGEVFGRVRAMFDDRGRAISIASPSTPIEVLGLQGVPHAGDPLQVVKDATQAQHIANQRQMQARQAAIARTSARSLEQMLSDKSAVKELLVILKGDVQGSVEAVRDSLLKLSTERVQIRIIRSGVGAITESDVMLASASSKDMNRASVIIGFNVRPETRAREIAEHEGVDIRLHTIIYKLEEEIHNAMLGLLAPIKREIITGHAQVRQVFKVPKIGLIAGCSVTDGTIRRTTARILRDNVVVYEGRIDSLRRVKDDVSEVRQGFECGISLERFQDVKLGDVIEAYTTEEVAPTQL